MNIRFKIFIRYGIAEYHSRREVIFLKYFDEMKNFRKKKKKKIKINENSQRNHLKIKMKNLMNIFLILVTGYLISSFIFIFEIMTKVLLTFVIYYH